MISTFKSGIDSISKTTNDFMNKPKVAKNIDKAKDVTIDIAEKTLDGLKKLLEG